MSVVAAEGRQEVYAGGHFSGLETAGNVAGGDDECLASGAAQQANSTAHAEEAAQVAHGSVHDAVKAAFKHGAGKSGGEKLGPIPGYASDKRQNVVEWERGAMEDRPD